MADKEVRALLVHPAAWTGIVRFLDQRGIDVDPVGDLEGIPTFSMGVRSLDVPPAPSVGADPEDEVLMVVAEDRARRDTGERRDLDEVLAELREDERQHAELNPKLATPTTTEP